MTLFLSLHRYGFISEDLFRNPTKMTDQIFSHPQQFLNTQDGKSMLRGTLHYTDSEKYDIVPEDLLIAQDFSASVPNISSRVETTERFSMTTFQTYQDVIKSKNNVLKASVVYNFLMNNNGSRDQKNMEIEGTQKEGNQASILYKSPV